MFKRIKRKIRKTRLKVSRWLRDPDLDIIGVGVISTFIGRTMVFGSFSWAFLIAGLPGQATIFTAMILMDATIHLEVLAALRRLMRYDVLMELSHLGRKPMLMMG